jgi:hypothetical protein
MASVDIDPDDVSRSVGVDPVAKEVYVTTEAGTVSKLLPDGTNKTTFAVGLTNPQGIAFVPSGVPTTKPGVYVADPDASTVFRIPTNGIPVVFVTGGTPNFLAFESISGADPTPTPTPTPSPTASPTPTVSPTPTPSPAVGKALNISTRVDVETGDNVAIGGFIITGGTTPKTVIIRAIGPSLATSGVTGLLADPILELHEPDGSWMRHRVIGVPAHTEYPHSSCTSSTYSSNCTYYPGGYVPEVDSDDEWYAVRPETVLPDEPGHLP